MRDVLIVDDEVSIGTNLVTLLSSSGHRAKCISNLKDAEEDMRQWANSYDVLVADVEVAGTSGLEFAKKVRVLFPHIKVIIMSGREKYRLEAEQSGFAFIQKPFGYKMLEALLEC